MLVNTDTKTTDENGEFSASLENSKYYTISSAIDAISFTPLYETGGQFAARRPVTIEASRLVSSVEDPCRVVIGTTPHVYFSSVNTTDRTLTVPLNYTGINSMLSVAGEAVPPENFAPGTSGFSLPESYFRSGATLMGVWKFLGQEIAINDGLQVCTDRGAPSSCEALDPATVRSPFDYTRRVILRLTNLAIRAARSGQWKSATGNFSAPFMSRGAKALVSMERAFRDSKTQLFVCEATPPSCTAKQLPKQALIRAFAQIFEGQVPRGLKHISAMSKREVALFRRELNRLPNTYVLCGK